MHMPTMMHRPTKHATRKKARKDTAKMNGCSVFLLPVGAEELEMLGSEMRDARTEDVGLGGSDGCGE